MSCSSNDMKPPNARGAPTRTLPQGRSHKDPEGNPTNRNRLATFLLRFDVADNHQDRPPPHDGHDQHRRAYLGSETGH